MENGNRTNSPDISDLLVCRHTHLTGLGEGKFSCVNCSKIFTEYQLMGPVDYSYREDEPGVYKLGEN